MQWVIGLFLQQSILYRLEQLSQRRDLVLCGRLRTACSCAWGGMLRQQRASRRDGGLSLTQRNLWPGWKTALDFSRESRVGRKRMKAPLPAESLYALRKRKGLVRSSPGTPAFSQAKGFNPTETVAVLISF